MGGGRGRKRSRWWEREDEEYGVGGGRGRKRSRGWGEEEGKRRNRKEE